jgi:predicted RNA-binding Zn ribbon-like protein
MSKQRSINSLPLDGGALCFHFINTVNAWTGTAIQEHEYLSDYEEFIRWCEKVAILSEKTRKALSLFAGKNAEAAAAALQKLKKIREMLYHFFSSVAADNGKTMDPALLERFNKTLSMAISYLRFDITTEGIVNKVQEDAADLLTPLRIIMKSAYDILTTEDHTKIKECETCGWIFLDHTKNNKKRWCSPQTCGSMDKAKRYYQRKKDQ